MLAAWERVKQQERKGSEKRRREDLRSKRKAQEPAAWIGKMQEEMHEIPVFRPTAEEFEDPYVYLRSIAAEGAKFGALKIIPPETFRPTCRPSRAVIDTTRQTLLNKWFDSVRKDDGGREGGHPHVDDEHAKGVAFQTSHKRDFHSYTISECVFSSSSHRCLQSHACPRCTCICTTSVVCYAQVDLCLEKCVGGDASLYVC